MKTFFFFTPFFLFFSSCCQLGSDLDINAWKVFTTNYASKMNQLHNWNLIGYGSALHKNIEKISFKFTVNEKLTLEETRSLIIENVQYLHQLINADFLLLPYLEETPFNRKKIDLGLLFLEKESKNYMPPPYIAYVTYLEGKIGYARFNEQKDTLDIIHRESYEEALLIVNQEQNYQ